MVVVDDTTSLRTILTRILEDAQYCVVAAENGAAALAYLNTCAPLPDLIVMDLHMPIMNGWSFRQAQRRDPRLQHIPVIVCSAEPQEYRLIALAADGYLQKPVEVTALLDLIAALMER